MQEIANLKYWVVTDMAAHQLDVAKHVGWVGSRVKSVDDMIDSYLSRNACLLKHLFPRTASPTTSDRRSPGHLQYALAAATLMSMIYNLGPAVDSLSQPAETAFAIQRLVEDVAGVYSEMPLTIAHYSMICTRPTKGLRDEIAESSSRRYKGKQITMPDDSRKCLCLHIKGIHAISIARLHRDGSALQQGNAGPLVSGDTLVRLRTLTAPCLGTKCVADVFSTSLCQTASRGGGQVEFMSPTLEALRSDVLCHLRCVSRSWFVCVRAFGLLSHERTVP